MLFRSVLSALVLIASVAPVTSKAATLPNAGGLQAVHARDGREILADSKGLTVYTFSPDSADVSVCYDRCAVEWPPVLLPAGEVVAPPYGTTTRKDGSVQMTYNHRPLYNYDDDKITGDIFGDGKHGVWFVVETAQSN